jgi:hypothetical protein
MFTIKAFCSKYSIMRNVLFIFDFEARVGCGRYWRYYCAVSQLFFDNSAKSFSNPKNSWIIMEIVSFSMSIFPHYKKSTSWTLPLKNPKN